MDNTAQDVGGNALNNYQGSFRVTGSAVTGATVVATSPTYGSNTAPVNTAIDLQYTEALDPLTVNTTSVRFYDYQTSQTVSGAVSLTKGGRVIRVVPQAVLTANHLYAVQTTGVRDLDGQNATNYFMYFTTNAVGGCRYPGAARGDDESAERVDERGDQRACARALRRADQPDQSAAGSGADDVWVAVLQ